MRILEKGLTHHHTKCRTICMRKSDGMKAKTDEENSQVFCEHFSKKIDKQSPLPYNHTVL
eukprot:9837553-Ditylum_brightwellii.AAC.1